VDDITDNLKGINMRIIQQFIPIFLIFALTTTPLASQPEAAACCQEEACCEEEPIAYQEGCYAAHWSAYIPITVLVVAALFFGVCDQKSTSSSCHSDEHGWRSEYRSRSSYGSGYSHRHDPSSRSSYGHH